MSVSDRHSELIKNRLASTGEPVEYLAFDGPDHGLAYGLVHGQARSIMLKRIGEFLETALRPRAGG